MNPTLKAALTEWSDFYLITGGAAAALTGLQFVVQTLLASETIRPVTSGDPEGGVSAFGTPTVVHFTLALVFSAMMCVPWPGYTSLRVSLGVLSILALGYSIIVMRLALQQKSYVPVAEDWAFHIVLPGVAYGGVLACAMFFGRSEEWELFTIAAATLLLLCIGIHNAWDTVTWLTFAAIRRDPPASAPPQPKQNNPGSRRKRRR